MAMPKHVWQSTWHHLGDDVLHDYRPKMGHYLELVLTEDEINCLFGVALSGDFTLLNRFTTINHLISSLCQTDTKNFTLHEIEEMLNRNGCTLAQHEGMNLPKDTTVENMMNSFIVEELAYDVAYHERLYPCLTGEQRSVYETIMDAIDSGTAGFFSCTDMGARGRLFSGGHCVRL